jgi:hypothetical protein
MSTTAWIILVVAIAVVAVIALLVAARASTARRRTHLQETFGPEYDRTVGDSGSRRDAERDLAEREQRRAELQIKPLSEAARARFSEEWQGVQQRFVDDPEGAATQAEHLVRRVMDERGYPADDGREGLANVVSVDHPDVVQRYRQGCDTLASPSGGTDERTENLRKAMVDFRSVFESLIERDTETATMR